MAVLQTPAPLPPPDIPPEVIAWLQRVPPELAVLIPLTALLIGGGLLFLVVRAVARRVEGGAGIRALRDEVEVLRERVAELESAPLRIADLEDRLEFSERLLAQQAQVRAPGADHG